MAQRIPARISSSSAQTYLLRDSLIQNVKPTAPPLSEMQFWDKAERIYKDYQESLKVHEGVLSKSEMALQADELIHLVANQVRKGDFNGFWDEKLAKAGHNLWMAHTAFAGTSAAVQNQKTLNERARSMEKYFIKVLNAIGLTADEETLTDLMYRKEEPISYAEFHQKMYSLHARNELEEDRGRIDEKKKVDLPMEAAQLIRDQIGGGRFGEPKEDHHIKVKRRSRLVYLAIKIKKNWNFYENVDAGNPYALDVDTRPIEAARRSEFADIMVYHLENLLQVAGFHDPDEPIKK